MIPSDTASPDERVAAAIATVQQAPGELDRWFDLLAVLVELGRYAQALHVLEQRHQHGGDGMSLTFDGIGRLLLMGMIDPVAAFTEQMPPNHIFTPVTLMLQAWVATAREDSDLAIGLIRRAVQTVPAIKDFVSRDMVFQNRNYPQMLNQAEQLDLASEVLAAGTPETSPPILLEPSEGVTARRVVVAAADSRYTKRFAGDFLRSFQGVASQEMLLHLHVIAPDAETDAMLDEFSRGEPRLRISRQTEGIQGTQTVYSACSRFLIAPLLIKHYQLPLLLTDIDITFSQPITSITQLTDTFDVALFETGSPFPPLRCSAVAVHFAASEPAMRFLALLARYLGRKLRAGSHWMLDQSAIWAVSRACRDLPTPIAYGNIAELCKSGWKEFVAPIPITEEEKQRLRWADSAS